MNRIIITVLTLVTGFFALMASLVLAIPLAIAALIAGKRIENQFKKAYVQQAQSSSQPQAHASSAIEGEFEEVHSK